MIPLHKRYVVNYKVYQVTEDNKVDYVNYLVVTVIYLVIPEFNVVIINVYVKDFNINNFFNNYHSVFYNKVEFLSVTIDVINVKIGSIKYTKRYLRDIFLNFKVKDFDFYHFSSHIIDFISFIDPRIFNYLVMFTKIKRVNK